MSPSNNTATLENTVTPHGVHKIVNQALEAAGSNFRIPPQMMYNYTTGAIKKNGKAHKSLRDGVVTLVNGEKGNQVRVRIEVAQAFATAYTEGRLAREAATSAATEAELEGETAPSDTPSEPVDA